MKVEIDVTPEEYRAVHDLCAFVLRPRALDDDPDVRPLVSFFRKWKQQEGPVLCGRGCRRIVYAKGLCRGCYQKQRRAS